MFLFKNLTVYQLNIQINPADLAERMKSDQYEELKHQSLSVGWVEPIPFASHGLVHSYQEQHLLKFRRGRKVIPGNVFRDALAERIEDFSREAGYKPGKRMVKELKERALIGLLEKAFTAVSDTYVWINNPKGLLFIASPSRGIVNQILERFSVMYADENTYLEQTLEQRIIERVPGAAYISRGLTNWVLAEQSQNDLFYVNDGAVLLSSYRHGKGDVRFTVRPTDEEKRSVSVGEERLCSSLSLTWADKIVFTLTSDMVFKNIKALDILKNELATDPDLDPQYAFDTDFYLETGEITQLLEDLMSELAGVISGEA